MAGWDDIPDEKTKDPWDAIPNETQPKVPPQTSPKSYALGQVPGAALSNIPGGLGEYFKTFIKPETYQNITALAQSGHPLGWLMNYIQRGKLPLEDALTAGQSYGLNLKNKYGGWEQAKRTVAEKPVEFLSDLSTALMGAGAATKIPALSRVGQFVEPLSVAGKGAEAVMGGLKRVGTGLLGISTGAGKVPVEKAIEASPAFKSALRGGIEGQEIVDKAKGGVYAIKAERGNLYRQQLEAIENMPNPPVMDIASPVREFNKALKEFNVEMMQGKGGNLELNFGRSTIRNNPIAQNDFNRVLDTLQGVLKDKDYFQTPKGFDVLKRQLSDMYKESSQGRVIVERLQKDVRNQLVNRVPGYEDMVKGYEKTTKLVNEIEKDLTLGKRGSADTAIRKLNTAMREDDDFRRGLVAQVERSSGENISDMISGRLMSTWMPKSWMGREIAAGTIFASIFGNPAVLPALASASPRLVAETLMLLSSAGKAGKPIVGPTFAPTRQAIYQLGKPREIERER